MRRLPGRRNDAGVTTTTTAILMPVVVGMVAVVVQAGIYYHYVQRAEAAADRAVTAAAAAGGTTSDGQAAAQTFLEGAPLDDAAVTVTRGAEETRATVAGTAPQLIPGVSWRIQARAVAATERFVPEPDRR